MVSERPWWYGGGDVPNSVRSATYTPDAQPTTNEFFPPLAIRAPS